MLTLDVFPGELAICRLPPAAALPAWAETGGFHAVTRTAGELSIVCPAGLVPGSVQSERGWRCLGVRGPLDFGLTGVLASLANPLAEAGISIFAVSTYDTDHILVRAQQLGAAVAALRRAGHQVAGAAC